MLHSGGRRAARQLERFPPLCRNRRGGRDHIWLVTFDEASCYVPAAIRASIILSHWGRMDANHTSGSGCACLPLGLAVAGCGRDSMRRWRWRPQRAVPPLALPTAGRALARLRGGPTPRRFALPVPPLMYRTFCTARYWEDVYSDEVHHPHVRGGQPCPQTTGRHSPGGSFDLRGGQGQRPPWRSPGLPAVAAPACC